jgi:hypothetical protein
MKMFIKLMLINSNLDNLIQQRPCCSTTVTECLPRQLKVSASGWCLLLN